MSATIDEKRAPKHKEVYDYVVDAIEQNLFTPGKRLPSERMLASQLNVNEATIRRAFKDLAARGIVERRVGDGTYLREIVSAPPETQVLNIVLSNYPGSFQAIFPDLCREHNLDAKRHLNITCVSQEDAQHTLRALAEHREPTLILGDDITITDRSIREIQKHPECFAVIAKRLDSLGIPSVVGDDTYGMRLLIEHLQQLGHRRIAILHTQGANNSHDGHFVEKNQVAVWRSAIPAEWHSELELTVEVPRNAIPTGYAYQRVLEACKRKTDFTAVICVMDVLAMGAIAAFAESGRQVPGEFSVAAIGDTAITRFCQPPITCINSDLPEHIRQAYSLLENNFFQGKSIDLLRLVEPHLVVRKSVHKIS